MTSGGNNFNYFAENQLTKFFQDLKLQFPGLSRAKVIFQDFPGPGNLKKKIQDFLGGVETQNSNSCLSENYRLKQPFFEFVLHLYPEYNTSYVHYIMLFYNLCQVRIVFMRALVGCFTLRSRFLKKHKFDITRFSIIICTESQK